MATLKLKTPRIKPIEQPAQQPEQKKPISKSQKKRNRALNADQAAAGAARRLAHIQAAEAWLQTLPVYTSFLPLAIGFRKQIQPRPEGITANGFQRAMAAHVKSLAYLYALSLPDSVRHNADGSAAGPASWADREYAKELLSALHGVE